MSAAGLPSTSSRLRLTSSFRVVRAFVVLLQASLVYFAGRVSAQDDPLEPWTPVPEYLPGPTEITARQGDRAVLPCGIHNLGTKQVAWKRTDQHFFVTVGTMKWASDDAIAVEARQDEQSDLTYWDLVFDPVRAEHAGVYECQISAKHKQNRNLTLRVVGPPVLKAVKPGLVLEGDKYVELGQKILLKCTAHTGPHAHQDIDWFKDGDKIVSNSRKGVVITKYNSALTKSLVSELIVDHSKASDTGTYICRSASEEIESLKVTVLNADTTNVKREHDYGGRGKGTKYLRRGDDDTDSRASSHLQPRPLLLHIITLTCLLLSRLLLTS